MAHFYVTEKMRAGGTASQISAKGLPAGGTSANKIDVEVKVAGTTYAIKVGDSHSLWLQHQADKVAVKPLFDLVWESKGEVSFEIVS